MPTGVGIAPDLSSVRADTAEIALVLDRLQARLDRTPLAAGEVTGLVGDLDRITRRVEAIKLHVLRGEAATRAAQDAGFRDTSAWLARKTRVTGGQAARQVRLAEQLHNAGQTGAALAEGDISPDHAEVVTDALGKLPHRLTDAERETVEAGLLRKAQTMDPAQLRKAARRALAAVEPDPAVVDAHENQLLENEEDRARAKTSLTWHDNGDGTIRLSAVMPTLAGEFLQKVIHTMTAPRRNPITGEPDRVPASTEWAHRRGLAFLTLLERIPTDHLHPKTAATVVIHLRHDVLLGALAAAGVETGESISAATARRLACEAAIIPTVLGGKSLPLDLGQQRRLYTDHQPVAISIRHTHCAAEGCTVPFAWCELHHRTPWSRGGPTNLANAVPLCSFHHHQTHRTDPSARTGPPRAEQAWGKNKTKPVRIPTQRRAPART